MGFPNLPDINPDINLDSKDVVILLLASIASEELGLAHIINAEAEKIQAAVGTLKNDNQLIYDKPLVDDLDDLLEINESVEKILQSVIKKEMLLQFKFDNVLKFWKNIKK